MGKCKFSNLIVPQVMKKIQQIYKRTSMPKCDFNKPSFNYRKIVSKKVTIGGRKISITKKEKNFQQKNNKYMWLCANDEF